jgi:DNA repair exonuclease SbcCD ATPase subunit
MNDATVPQQDKGKPAGSYIGFLAACLILAVVIIVLGVKVHSLNAQLSDTQAQVAAAKADAAQVQTDLGMAKAASVGLQAQLDKANASVADLGAQLDKAKTQRADLLSQLEKAKPYEAQAANLQAQLDKANAQAAAFQKQCNQATAGSFQLQAQLDQAKSQLSDLKSQLQKTESELAKLQPMVAKARQMPVTASFDRGTWGSITSQSSYRLRIHNLSPNQLKVDVTVTGLQKTRSFSYVMEADGTLNVDKLTAGEKVVIAGEGYDALTLTVQ